MGSEITLDAKTMHVLTHPLRLQLLAALRIDGAATASQLAKRFGESSGATSYHLRQLARYGLIEEGASGRGRERYWKASHDRMRVELVELLGTDTGRTAASWFIREVVALHVRWMQEWLDGYASWDPAWLAAAATRDSFLRVDAEELGELVGQLKNVIARFEARSELRSETGSEPRVERVVVMLHAFPQRTTPL